MDQRIPKAYQTLWAPFEYDGVLYHLTTKNNLDSIQKVGYIEPRDPAPRNWAGMKAIFMGYADDPLYAPSQKNVHAHIKKKGDKLVRLQIKTTNPLYRSKDPERTFQVMSLDPIPVNDIVSTEEL